MYHNISFDQFDATMKKIGAHRVRIPGTFEIVYELPIRTNSGKEYPENIRIYSSIHAGGMSRGRGKDAIKVVLIRDERILISTRRVNRSSTPEIVLGRVVDRVRAAFKYSITPENRGPSGHLYTKNRTIE